MDGEPSQPPGLRADRRGLLLIAGPVDGDQLIEAVRTGYERGKGSLQGYDPTDATG
jgi:hypothetical protein